MNSRSGVIEVLPSFCKPALGLGEKTSAEQGRAVSVLFLPLVHERLQPLPPGQEAAGVVDPPFDRFQWRIRASWATSTVSKPWSELVTSKPSGGQALDEGPGLFSQGRHRGSASRVLGFLPDADQLDEDLGRGVLVGFREASEHVFGRGRDGPLNPAHRIVCLVGQDRPPPLFPQLLQQEGE